MKSWGSRCTDPRFLDLGTRWRWVVSFVPLLFYPRYLLVKRLGGPQSRSGRYGEAKTLILPRLELQPLRRPARRESLYWLSYHIINCKRDLFQSHQHLHRDREKSQDNSVWEHLPWFQSKYRRKSNAYHKNFCPTPRKHRHGVITIKPEFWYQKKGVLSSPAP
jgi:hypothetical protein